MEAVLYQHKDAGKLVCTACVRRCILGEGQTGYCGIRKNNGGNLDLLVYGMPFGMHIDPIEKKPVLHAMPGAKILSFGTTGCNYGCRYCQNFDMSQRREVAGESMTPESIVSLAIRTGCRGIAYTYNEPTVFLEFAHDVGLEARKRGLKNIFVTNGYETREAIEYASSFLDYITIDFKGNANNNFYRKYISVISADPIYDTIKNLLDFGMHVEVTDLVVPQVGDDLKDAERMVDRIREIGGEGIPVSFLRFHPDYRMLDLPLTSVKTLEEHRDMAIDHGMNYAYIGNVFGHKYESTYCPRCRQLLVKRNGFTSKIVGLDESGRCTSCGYSTRFENLKASIPHPVM